MVHRGTTRESKSLKKREVPSTAEDKARRHRNKLRIWRRAIRRIELAAEAARIVEEGVPA